MIEPATGARKALPYLKLFPRDWRSDVGVQSCSIAARGVWFEMLLLMHSAEPYGRLVVKGKEMTTGMLGRLIGVTQTELAPLLDELEAAEVFSRDTTGIIHCRRMVRDEATRQLRADGGPLGGNPTLMKVRAKDNLPPNLPTESGLENHEDSSCARGTRAEPLSSETLISEKNPEPDSARARARRKPAEPWQSVIAKPEFAAVRAATTFLAAWAEWIEHCSTAGAQSQLPAGPRCVAMLREALQVGLERYAAALRQAIASNWKGPHVEALTRGGHVNRVAEVRAAQEEYLDDAYRKAGRA